MAEKLVIAIKDTDNFILLFGAKSNIVGKVVLVGMSGLKPPVVLIVTLENIFCPRSSVG